MTIEIDDSGTGDLIGSAFVLSWRKETNTLVCKEVPLKLYQSSDYDILTKNFIRDLFVDAFKEMEIEKTEDIYKSIDTAVAKMERQLKRYKEKKTHQHVAVKDLEL